MVYWSAFDHWPPIVSPYEARVTGTNTISVFPHWRVADYYDGLSIRFVPAADNTGNVTLNVSNLGAKSVRKGTGNTQLASGDLEQGKAVWCQYDGTRFKLISSENEVQGRFRFNKASQIGGTANAITLDTASTWSGHPLPAYAAGQHYQFFAEHTNTGAVTVNVDGRGVKALTKFGDTALEAGDIHAGDWVLIAYDGTRFQAVSMEIPRVPAPLLTEPFRTLAFATSLAWNVGTHPNAEVTVTDDVSSFSVSGALDGGIYRLTIKMDSTGGHDFPFPSGWEWPGGTEGEVSSGANAIDRLTLAREGSEYAAILVNDWGT